MSLNYYDLKIVLYFEFIYLSTFLLVHTLKIHVGLKFMLCLHSFWISINLTSKISLLILCIPIFQLGQFLGGHNRPASTQIVKTELEPKQRTCIIN